MTLTFQGRLPGITCSPQLPTLPQPIRLDVAAFVGLALKGPVNQPIPLRDFNQYQLLFGGDLELAQDTNRVPVYANLPYTVKSFFDNGGVRCYVVRVVGPNATPARWMVPGIRQWWPNGAVEDVFVQAAWPGAWSTGFEVGTQLLLQPVSVTGPYAPAGPGGPGSLPLSAPSALALVPGDLVQLDFGPSAPGLYITITSVNADYSATSAASMAAPSWSATVGYEVPSSLSAAQDLPGPLEVVSAVLLRLDVVVQQVPVGGGAGQQLEEWPGLSFNFPGGTAASCWVNVAQTALVQGQEPPVPDYNRSLFLRADPATVRNPPAAGEQQPYVFVPLDMDMLGTAAEWDDANAGSPPYPGTWAGLDDLSTFDPVKLFLDPQLLNDTVDDLINDANQLTTLAPRSQWTQLRGIHSLVAQEDVAMISVPDAAQLGWAQMTSTQTAQSFPPIQTGAPVDWASFHDCWQPTTDASPPAVSATTPASLPYPLANDPGYYDAAGLCAGLMAVQVALVTLCAARADVVALLSLPAHYGSQDVVTWSQNIVAANPAGAAGVDPLSFAAVWHPWGQIVEPTSPALAPLRSLPPDGPAAGTIAAQEIASGVWVAPANISVRGLVSLTPNFSAADEVLAFNAHDNIMVRRPGSYVGLSAHTLSSDPQLLQVSVRRLVIFLRKLCLQRGQRYVFQTNTDRFRDMVARSFERLLGALLDLGAITNFQVIADASVNTSASVGNGQFVIMLLIAPTNPIEFITVTLVRSGEGLLDVLEGSA